MTGSPLPFVNIRRFLKKLIAEMVNGYPVTKGINLRDDERRDVVAHRRWIPDADGKPLRGTVPHDGLGQHGVKQGYEKEKSGDDSEHARADRIETWFHRVQSEYREGASQRQTRLTDRIRRVRLTRGP